ncbi:hypothetical protein HDV00_012260 [Rhizophlyctis rosea]|nr:hypothetical protein HDV00_012260 [Rhizophlyctis rosea]
MCYWSQNGNLSIDADLERSLTPVLGAQLTKEALTAAQDQSIKDELSRITKEALDQGAFGAPWMEVDQGQEGGGKSYYFGSDRFEQMAMVLGKKWHGPVGVLNSNL